MARLFVSALAAAALLLQQPQKCSAFNNRLSGQKWRRVSRLALDAASSSSDCRGAARRRFDGDVRLASRSGQTGRSRRDALLGSAAALLAGGYAFVAAARPAAAAVTDETNAFANTASDSSYANLFSNSPPPSSVMQPEAVASDEIALSIPKSDIATGGGLGIELADVEFRTNRRVFVKSVRPGGLGERLGIKKDWIVVNVDGQSAERTNAEGVAIMVSRSVRGGAGDALELRFRDPDAFRNRLRTLSAGEGGEVTTQVAPAGDTTQRNADGSVRLGEAVTSQLDQKLTVSQLIPPKYCTRGATTDDLLEISYLGTVVDTGVVFDGSAIKIDGRTVPGRGNDVSLFFVLGKQPFGQFPPGWDAGLEGMCVGERRRVIVPPVLAYGSTGVPRRGIPPNATLQYDITLVSINGLAMPQ